MKFSSEQQLAEFLGSLEPHYRGYATALWASGVRSADELARGSVDTYSAAGITNRWHAETIKATAGELTKYHIRSPADDVADLLKRAMRMCKNVRSQWAGPAVAKHYKAH
jgi:hypothetical protein